ncbi:MAG TPA: ABC transporter permease [Candidatus Hydrogenedentes bacterium]|jgi:ribose/xylose/arabinose/galactoside ABC-type transport system permease subunit|nr:ABC transporter permease [Candidatus Hydrogenedentota bacterium]HOD95724.1 ABC transporter permease [Candidatus Hydrogenedentota bacterium]HOR51118.1 ABC transporter permease [Candidatus Hydrogenedentota bacterium]HPK25061.1 ABC transporter permease [Candidatus Hydrogenedentota bacterium]HPX86739.1 ABC transporter permease [Candidatus Hydrogenedentota bacterium]
MGRFIAKHSPLFILAALCIILAVVSPVFRSPSNLQGVAQRTAVVGIMAVGQLAVILTAGIDLSVGSIAALSGVVGCLAMVNLSVPAIPGIFIGIGVGLLCGLVNGLLTAKGKIPPFIVTLGMMMAARGAALTASGATPVFGLPENFAWLGGTRGWWLPVVFMFGIAAFFAVVLGYTRFGRALYVIGGNKEAARLSGVPVDWVRIAAFAISGTAAGFAGMMLASRTSVASPTAAEMYELQAIAACVIGGASLMGGEGGAFATIAGALIMTVLYNFCNLQNINVHWQQILVGVLLVALVFYDNRRKRKAGLLKD